MKLAEEVNQYKVGDINLKRETVLKKLKGYAKSLAFMEQESIMQNYPTDTEHYRFDKLVFEEAIKIIERSNI